jgi:hypothetical protein
MCKNKKVYWHGPGAQQMTVKYSALILFVELYKTDLLINAKQ